MQTYVFSDEEEETIFGVSSEPEHDFGSAAWLEATTVQNDVTIALELHRVRSLLREIAVGQGGW